MFNTKPPVILYLSFLSLTFAFIPVFYVFHTNFNILAFSFFGHCCVDVHIKNDKQRAIWELNNERAPQVPLGVPISPFSVSSPFLLPILASSRQGWCQFFLVFSDQWLVPCLTGVVDCSKSTLCFCVLTVNLLSIRVLPVWFFYQHVFGKFSVDCDSILAMFSRSWLWFGYFQWVVFRHCFAESGDLQPAFGCFAALFWRV